MGKNSLKGDSLMDQILVEQTRDYMSSKSTEELVKIWIENDRAKNVEETF